MGQTTWRLRHGEGINRTSKYRGDAAGLGGLGYNPGGATRARIHSTYTLLLP